MPGAEVFRDFALIYTFAAGVFLFIGAASDSVLIPTLRAYRS
ncbi:hypothetical protein [Rubrobacter taiwanensis]|nr:hypothetical protein [Rubrobacter taiwanensis]